MITRMMSWKINVSIKYKLFGHFPRLVFNDFLGRFVDYFLLSGWLVDLFLFRMRNTIPVLLGNPQVPVTAGAAEDGGDWNLAEL